LTDRIDLEKNVAPVHGPKVEDEKKSPALTLAQSKMLMQSVLGLPELDFKFALEVVMYHQERNYEAYCSHRKRTLKSLKRKSKRPK